MHKPCVSLIWFEVYLQMYNTCVLVVFQSQEINEGMRARARGEMPEEPRASVLDKVQ